MLLDPDLGYFDEGLDLTDEALYRSASGRVGEARTLPPTSYRSKIFASLEDNRVWSRNWIGVGASEQIPEAGDILPFTIGYHGIHLQRMPDGSIAGRFNKAQHGGCRSVPLQCQTGSRTKCSFTACGYSRDRDVIPASELDDDRSAAQQYLGLRPERLLPVRVAENGSLLFACLDPRTPHLDQSMAAVGLSTDDWPPVSADLVAKKWIAAPANWKLIASNIASLITGGVDIEAEGIAGLQVDVPSLSCVASSTGLATAPSGLEGQSNFAWIFPNVLLLRSEGAAIAILLQPLSMVETQLRILCFGGHETGDALLAFALAIARNAGQSASSSQKQLSDWGTSRAPETEGLPAPFQDSPFGLAFQRVLIDSILTPAQPGG